ncbi:MAG: PKD domain-containing protein, partial [Bacteroidetes bacterium]|nr:PKD domain-containing protein [Bacteroidota bacterium]
VLSTGGCVDTITKTIKILQQQVPIADFTASNFNPYVSQTVNLIDQSVNVPTKWKWTITPNKYTYKNNTNDSSQSPEVSFDSLTTYSVFLEAINAAGSTTTNKTITTKNYTKPLARIGAQTNFVRVGELVNFIDSSDNDPTAWSWNFGDTASGINNLSSLDFPTHAYSKAGFYDVGLKVTNPGGNDTTYRIKYIEVSNGFNMCDNTASSSNVLQGFLFDSGGPNANYTDGNDCAFLIEPPCIGKIFLNFSSFNLSAGDYLQVYDGIDSVNGKPLFPGKGFTGNNLPGTLTSNSGAFYIREMTDGNTNSSGFSASWTSIPNVKPKAKIGNDSIAYINSPVNFKNTSFAGYQNKYYWDFDNDGIDDDSTTSPIYTYSILGTKKVRLIAINCAGADTFYKDINIKNPTASPVANFKSDKDTVAIIDFVQLTDLSTNGPSSWLWDITPAASTFYVNGTDPTFQNPVVTFSAAGNYNVCLTSTNTVGSSVNVCKNNYIIVKDRQNMCSGNPSTNVAAGLFYDSGDQGFNYGDNENCNFLIQPCADNVVLKFKSFDLDNGDYLRVYDGVDNLGIPLFNGNGFTGTTNPGDLTSYSGSLYIEFSSDGAGNSSGWDAEWSSGAVTTPKSDFIVPNNIYSNCVTWFKNSSTGKSPSYEWDFDNNGNVDSTTIEGYHIYPSAGNYTVNLNAYNCAGSDTKLKQVTVTAPTTKPSAAFYANYTMGDTGSIITLYDTSSNGVNQWTWTVSPATGWFWEEELGYRQRIHFTDSGNYTICLTAGNGKGTDQICKNAYITIRAYCRPAPSYVSGVGISKISLHNFAQNTPLDRLYSDYSYLGSVTKLERKATYTLALEKNVAGVNQNWKG